MIDDVASRRDIAEAARLLRQVLDLVDRGDLEASAGPGVAMVRRLEGAATALEAASR